LFEEAVQLSQKVGIQRIETYALLDNGSKSTFCYALESAARKQGLS